MSKLVFIPDKNHIKTLIHKMEHIVFEKLSSNNKLNGIYFISQILIWGGIFLLAIYILQKANLLNIQ